jgi:hypothetical protein
MSISSSRLASAAASWLSGMQFASGSSGRSSANNDGDTGSGDNDALVDEMGDVRGDSGVLVGLGEVGETGWGECCDTGEDGGFGTADGIGEVSEDKGKTKWGSFPVVEHPGDNRSWSLASVGGRGELEDLACLTLM